MGDAPAAAGSAKSLVEAILGQIMTFYVTGMYIFYTAWTPVVHLCSEGACARGSKRRGSARQPVPLRGDAGQGLGQAELRLPPLRQRLPAAVGLPSLPGVEGARWRVLLEHPQSRRPGAGVPQFLLGLAQQEPADAATLKVRRDVQRADVSAAVPLALQPNQTTH